MRRIVRWIAAVAVALVAVGIWAMGLFSVRREIGYLSPLFAGDGLSVFAVTREVAATIAGFGQELFTPPASVWLHRDRYTLVNIRLADGRQTVIEEFPQSPLAGARISAYHPAIFGVPHAHLRWADADHLDYEVAVTRHDTPLSRTFVVRRRWNPAERRYVKTTAWEETSTGMAGDETQQLHGDLEAIAVPGDDAMPCGLAVLRRDNVTASTLIQTRSCRRKYPSGLTAAVLAPLSRRRDIERAETVRTTYADLIERGRQSGLPEGEAMLEAGRQMEGLGLFPKSTTLVAQREECGTRPAWITITDEQFHVGLFADIDRAVAQPGQEVAKSSGAYIVHRDYGTSQEINALLAAGRPELFVAARGGCWRLRIRNR
jgi:hypothetical protein